LITEGQIPHFWDESIVRADTALAPCSQPGSRNWMFEMWPQAQKKGQVLMGKIGKLVEVEQNMGIHPIPNH